MTSAYAGACSSRRDICETLLKRKFRKASVTHDLTTAERLARSPLLTQQEISLRNVRNDTGKV